MLTTCCIEAYMIEAYMYLFDKHLLLYRFKLDYILAHLCTNLGIAVLKQRICGSHISELL